ncbi:MAG: HNH endonuclease [Chloroflexota bacterium]
MSSYIPVALRRLITQRANQVCEYCLLPQLIVLTPHEPDHIVPEQHGGQTTEDNLALACMRCNRRKGTNIGSFDPLTGNLVRFFNPRIDKWEQHFDWDENQIIPISAEGRVTVKILNFNSEDRLMERDLGISLGLYPNR